MTALPVPGEPSVSQPSRMFYGKPLTFNEKRHMYFWDGKHVPSVTTIVNRLDKPGLVWWAAECACDHVRQKIAKGCCGHVPAISGTKEDGGDE